MEVIGCKAEYTSPCEGTANGILKDTTTADQALYEARHREHADSIKDEKVKSSVLEDISNGRKRRRLCGTWGESW
jgi:hypothetical protein